MIDLRPLNQYLYKYKYSFILGLVFIIGTHIFSIIPARLVKHMFDFIKENIETYQSLKKDTVAIPVYRGLLQGLCMYSIWIVLASFAKALCSFLLRQSILVTANKIECELKNLLYKHYQTLPVSFYRQHSTGDLMTRISEDITRVKMYLGPGILFGLNSLTLFAILVPYMFVINTKLTLWVMAPVPFLVLGIYCSSTFWYQRAERVQKKLATLTAFVQESFAGIRVVQSFALESDRINHFKNACESYKENALSLTAINALFFPLAIGVTGLGSIIAVYIGGKEVIKGTITIGNIVEFIMYMHLVTWPILSVSVVMNVIQRAAAAQRRINEFLEIKNSIVSTKNLIQPIHGKLTFDKVSFTYPTSGLQALQNISFQVLAGQSIAIVGTTGSGKSTLANLLVRLYDADQGTIMIDQIPIQAYEVAFLRQQIGYIQQEVFLLAGSLINNLTFGKVDASKADIIEAVKNADLHTSIEKFPKKMETWLGERGVTLSGGQKQRVAIARTLIKHPRILILDDCLSAVDTKTEYRILHTLAKVMRNKTTILLSNKVAIAQLAKEVLVLDAGKIAERGTHKSLLAAKGFYHFLHKKQKLT